MDLHSIGAAFFGFLTLLLGGNYFVHKWKLVDEYHTKLDKLREQITELNKNSILYWTSPDLDGQSLHTLSIDITNDFHTICSDCYSYQKRYSHFLFNDVIREINNLKIASTGNCFQTKNRPLDKTKQDTLTALSSKVLRPLDMCYISNRIFVMLKFWSFKI